MRLMYVPEFDDRSKVRGLVTAVAVVLRLREAEEKLHRREREFKTLVENSHGIITASTSRNAYLRQSRGRKSSPDASQWSMGASPWPKRSSVTCGASLALAHSPDFQMHVTKPVARKN